ncbi:tetratricopeptide repeat protein [Streptomyces nanshensis]|uniref:NB-ARC domain-containing protein n=1 Tax=Streptomyces nanshensis TaxID=518642 RepID=A0A1E7L9X2_9ACTN|nr:tetratricopeptide repeat protein [Streptomyces nanshensis]OEV12999.1 hypothetical protein AN218_05680 [Streptomyces nanshensis]
MSTENIINGGQGAQFRTVVQAHDIHTLHIVHPPPAPVPPHQLPPLTSAWVDREDELADLTDRVRQQPPYASTLALLFGDGGAGKSALAVRWLLAHREETPGGQLYVHLAGARTAAGGAALPTLLRRLLHDLGHPPAGDADVDELTGRWRSLTASRPTGLLLDDATDEDLVRALLPGGDGHLVAVTSRRQLTGLLRDGARLHPVPPLTPAAAGALLRRLVGEDRLPEEPAAVRQLTSRCGHLPLYLGLMAAQLVARPGLPMAEAAHHTEGPSVLDEIVDALHAPTARAYRLLSLLPGPDVDADAAGATLGLTRYLSTQTLTDLAGARLLENRGVHDGRGRVFGWHDEVRTHARTAAFREESPEDRSRALRRWLDYLLATTTQAERLLTPAHREVRRDITFWPVSPNFRKDEEAAQAWLVAHQDHIAAAVTTAKEHGVDTIVYQLPHAAWPLWRLHRPLELWLALHKQGLAAAVRCGDDLGQREMLTTGVIALRGLRDYEEAIEWADQAYSLAREAGDRAGTAQALYELAACHHEMGDHERAAGFLTETIRIREEIDYPRGVALSRHLLGEGAYATGHFPRAVAEFVLAAAGLRAAGDRFDAARADAMQGHTWTALRQYERAEELLHAAREEMRAVGSLPWESRVLDMLAQAAAAQHRIDEAIELFRRAQEIAEPSEADSIRARLADLTPEEDGRQ